MMRRWVLCTPAAGCWLALVWAAAPARSADGVVPPPAPKPPTPAMLPDPAALPAIPVLPPAPPTAATTPAAPETAQAAAPTEERLRALEAQNRELRQRLDDLYRRIDGQPPAGPGSGPVGPATSRQATTGTAAAPAVIREAPLANLPGQFGRPIPPGRDVTQADGEPLSRARVDLEQGVRFLSPDGRYRIEFHDLTQFEGRFFSPSGDPLHNNFDIPRQRLYFAGQVDNYFDFYSVLNRGYGTLDLLDSFVNFKFDKTFNIRTGLTKTPYTYEYYKIAEGDLIAPERSVFVGNLAPNRQIGVMAFGRVADERVEYAAGVFNGPHRSFQDFNNFKNPFFFLNTKPFLLGGSDLLRQLNVGGSVNFGRENDPLEPNAFRTANDETTTAAIDNVSPTFLRFTSNAQEVGDTAFWSGDVAWYYRSLTALAMYNGGYITYALPTRTGIRVPYLGYSVAVTYFLTGEEIITRKEVEPLRSFSWRNPAANPGAVEPYVRFSYLQAGQNIFSGGLADPKLWSRDAAVVDTGANWYLNRYVRLFLDWQYAHFGSPIQIGPGRFTNSTNMFWVRTQLYY